MKYTFDFGDKENKVLNFLKYKFNCKNKSQAFEIALEAVGKLYEKEMENVDQEVEGGEVKDGSVKD